MIADFEFELEELVRLADSSLLGIVEGRAEYVESNSMYFVRYVNHAGEPVSAWLYGSQLTT